MLLYYLGQILYLKLLNWLSISVVHKPTFNLRKKKQKTTMERITPLHNAGYATLLNECI